MGSQIMLSCPREHIGTKLEHFIRWFETVYDPLAT